ncbi:MAG: acetyl-CoA carboxylase biotin carboxylase subunit [Deltaproteobacteria bacterium]|nr:acetyl-CoA carboxylase biotin carboxylase subunit [Deltaproteobacteria bacterium]
MTIRKILIANRGEIAVRVARTCKELGIATVAVYSDADRAALHVRACDEAVRLGPAPSRESYLVQDAVLAACKATGADAIHPGYGFLSENATFARACKAAGITFIGPPAEAMDQMGEKTRARRTMIAAGVPVVPGLKEPIAETPEAVAESKRYAESIGYPIMLKAAAGGGGKGMRLVTEPKDFDASLATAQREALGAFGDGRVYLEKAITRPRHVEIQVFADTHGHAIYLGERECSVQRRHQKVVEETPSAIVTPELRAKMGEVAVKGALAVGYVGAGTFEFLVDGNTREFYFLEMNTRLQVEHPVTELCCGVDLVRWQIEVAQGAKLPWTQADVARNLRGHAIEVRLYAEDPAKNFLPSPGFVEELKLPEGPGIRNDCGFTSHSEVPRFYDPMIAKIAAWAPTRLEAIERLKRALSETMVRGITTNTTYLKGILGLEEFVHGDYDTGLLARAADRLLPKKKDEKAPLTAEEEIALAAAAIWQLEQDQRVALVGKSVAQAEESAWAKAGRLSALRR